MATFAVEVRDDGVYVGFPTQAAHAATVTDVMAKTMVNWGVRWVFGMVGHSNLGLADALRVQEQAGKLRFIGIRHEGAASFACSAYSKLTGRPAACLAIDNDVPVQEVDYDDLKARLVADGQILQWPPVVASRKITPANELPEDAPKLHIHAVACMGGGQVTTDAS